MERFDEFVERCLYDPRHGFYSVHGNAGGGRGDFITSPEVGPLFGAVLARVLDDCWHDLGRPGEFTLVDAGAGRGALAKSILAAEPECRAALSVVTVERSERLRRDQAALLLADRVDGSGWVRDTESGYARCGSVAVPVQIRADLPLEAFDGVIIANELLDNLPFRIVEGAGGVESRSESRRQPMVRPQRWSRPVRRTRSIPIFSRCCRPSMPFDFRCASGPTTGLAPPSAGSDAVD